MLSLLESKITPQITRTRVLLNITFPLVTNFLSKSLATAKAAGITVTQISIISKTFTRGSGLKKKNPFAEKVGTEG